MRITIIGLPTSGKSTVFRALTGADPGQGEGATTRAVAVPDVRVDTLSSLYSPKKTTYASVEYVDLGGGARLKGEAGELGAAFLTAVRPAAALVHVIDGFSLPPDETVAEAVDAVDTELVLSDLAVAEKRLERLRKQAAKSGPDVEEARLLELVIPVLGEGRPLRTVPELARADALRNFAFLSAKPVITVVNIAEDSIGWSPAGLPESVKAAREGEWGLVVPLCAQLEAEIAALVPEEARAFLLDFGIEAPARELVIRLSYDLLGLQSFYTVGEDEVRAWTIRRGAPAQEAAGAIHTDIARGFIRAEVVDYDTVLAVGSFDDARKRGKVRLEGKAYEMKDGDIVNFRFAV